MEHEGALRLLQGGRKEIGFKEPPGEAGGLWLTKHHALPSTNTVVALAAGEVIGALTLFGESAFQLPLEAQADLSGFKKNLEGRVAEVSYPGVSPEAAGNADVLLALYHFALCFGSAYCHYDAYLTQVPAAWAERYRGLLNYENLNVPERIPGLALYRTAREGADFQESFSSGFDVKFRFPERKFFLVAHQSLDPQTMHYLFNQRTRLFESLSDLEVRVLKNYYDYGEYAPILPNRELLLSFGKIPAHRRFPMACEGYLRHPRGQRIELQMLDASKEGLKIRSAEPLRLGADYPITLQVGVMKQAEVIARAVWVDEAAKVAGLNVRSGDRNWQRLIEYLECDFLRAVA
ncbi:MAG: hypothetical protein EOP11_23235 [Proteobacteria bacterium]|nr:MAG: hypothetical protein EOP11_23235 [Pseudomonadota bacterium]